jgi:O-antigen/teichoic acid export membrane protein
VNKVLQLLKKNLSVLLNAGAMVGTTAVTSLMGFAYWIVAPWFFSKHEIGLADTLFSAMSLLGAMSMMGLGTLLTGELTRQPGKEWSLINTALIVSGGIGVIAGVIFAFLAPFLPHMNSVGSSPLDIILFALGVSLTALTMVFDQAVIGILRGDLQLGRNTLFSAVKLGLLFGCYFLLWHTSMAIYVTWLLGNVFSLSVVFIRRSKKSAQETLGEIPVATSRALAFSGPLALSGPLTVSRPLTNFERSIRLPCPDCGTLSSNSASFCLNCGYPFSPTVEISSVRPQLLFDYGVIGLSESSMFRKRKSTASGNNICPECNNASPDYAMYCATCGFPLTPTIEMPSLKTGLSKLEIEAQDTLPLLVAIQREKNQQALSPESTMLISNPSRNAQNPAALQRTPLPIEAEETLIANLPRTPRSIENEPRPNSLDAKRSALFFGDEKTLNLPDLPITPRTNSANNTPLPQEGKKQSQKNTEDSIMPQWGFVRKLGKVALQHHAVNLVLLAPTQILPILVTILISVDTTTSFYDSFMLANFVFSLTYSLTTVLHAVSSAQPAILAQKIRFTLLLSLIASVGANLVLQVGAGLLLSFFKLGNVTEAAWCLRILSLAVFPIIIKSHFIAICRVHDRTAYMIIPIAIGSAIELGLAAVGAHYYGLVGLSLGWFATLILEALYMIPTVYKAANPVNVNIPPAGIGKKMAKA